MKTDFSSVRALACEALSLVAPLALRAQHGVIREYAAFDPKPQATVPWRRYYTVATRFQRVSAPASQ